PMDPVPEAVAQPSEPSEPSEPSVVESTCKCPDVDEVASCYATASFPDRSVDELAQVRVVFETDGDSEPPGYTHSLSAFGAALRDGGVAAFCGTTASAVTTVRFVLP